VNLLRNLTLPIYLINVKPRYILWVDYSILFGGIVMVDMIERILKDLGRINGVNGSLVVGKDGLIIESEVPGDIDSELVAAMASAVFGTAERSAEEMKHEPLQQVMIEGEKGKTLMIDAGEGILVVITDISINLGLIRIEMRRSAERVIDMLT
jgi:predicted regulator of Ras-like GTPase activity (Roadblock/LC7/MglB family)